MKRKEVTREVKVQMERRETDKFNHKKNTERHAPRERHREIERARVDARILRRQVGCDVL